MDGFTQEYRDLLRDTARDVEQILKLFAARDVTDEKKDEAYDKRFEAFDRRMRRAEGRIAAMSAAAGVLVGLGAKGIAALWH